MALLARHGFKRLIGLASNPSAADSLPVLAAGLRGFAAQAQPGL